MYIEYLPYCIPLLVVFVSAVKSTSKLQHDYLVKIEIDGVVCPKCGRRFRRHTHFCPFCNLDIPEPNVFSEFFKNLMQSFLAVVSFLVFVGLAYYYTLVPLLG